MGGRKAEALYEGGWVGYVLVYTALTGGALALTVAATIVRADAEALSQRRSYKIPAAAICPPAMNQDEWLSGPRVVEVKLYAVYD